ncbi:MAG: zinc ribbon domain-containing protein [Caldilineaceae bacterium]|nr:zinc ribbon domain-containing protein [Caldilineaceae bacterium]
MPIYEFVCPNCGCEFEKIVSFSDTATPVCPQCGEQHVERQVSRPAIHFKGSGWYITDSKSNGKKPAKDSANGAGSDSAKSESTGEGKSESPAESKPKSAKSEPSSSSTANSSTEA